MAVQDAARNIASDAVGAGVDQLSLHTTDGSTTGSNEISGGSYARQVPSYSGSASNGTDSLASSVVFGGPGTSQTVTHLGFWSGGGTTWLGSVLLTTSKTFVDPDTLTITSADIVVT